MCDQLNLLLTLRIDLFTLEEVYPDSYDSGIIKFDKILIRRCFHFLQSTCHRFFIQNLYLHNQSVFFFILDSLICLWEPNRIQCQSVAFSSWSGKNLLQCKPTPKCSRNVCAPSIFFSCFLKIQSCWINTITVLCFLYKSYYPTRISNIKLWPQTRILQ